ncbi:hypothetical protein CIW53_11260 [Rhodanobacter sp. T12-5]|nr:hypothetical protein CIW53_11260 [Rhodanobacter sp. T12-5]
MEAMGTDESLIKLVAEGSTPTSYSSFWMRESQAKAAIAEGRNLSDYFALPIGSEAPRYGMYRITPRIPTQVFINTVAPTSELGGLVTKSGGAEQVLVPNRKLFHDPVYVKSVDNIPSIAVEIERSVLSPAMVRGAATLGVAAVAHDATTTVAHASDLLQQNNIAGAQSTLLHFGGRNLGALGGAALGAEVFGAAGAETGPFDLLIGGAGAIGGAIAGDKLADTYDSHRIYNQPDAQGQTWHYDPGQPQQGWTRDVPPLPETPHGQHFTAHPALADQLNYQASSVAVELSLAHAPRPEDAYSLPAGSDDTPSIRDSPWTRDAQAHEWSRMVVTRVMEHGVVDAYEERADPQRKAELDKESEAVLVHNATRTPHAIATRYQSAYEQFGWDRFGPLPGPVARALCDSPARQQAPNGDTYTRDAQGQWSTPKWFGLEDQPAQGNLRDELNDAWRRQSGHEPTIPPAQASDPYQCVAAHVTRHSSTRDMFDALSHAAMNKDVDAMRVAGQAYLLSDRGQAWLEQGHQLNRQQAQQAALNAQQQQAPMQQGPVMQR